jgi:hypothetical protein
MAFTSTETEYMKNNSHVFETRSLTQILNTLDKSVQAGDLLWHQASKIAFYSAMVIDPDSIVLVVENRGRSRSLPRANAGQKIMRVYYGVQDSSIVVGSEGSGSRIRWLPGSIKIFQFTFFKGTLSPNALERLLLDPLLKYNKKIFGKDFESFSRKMMAKVDWGTI